MRKRKVEMVANPPVKLWINEKGECEEKPNCAKCTYLNKNPEGRFWKCDCSHGFADGQEVEEGMFCSYYEEW